MRDTIYRPLLHYEIVSHIDFQLYQIWVEKIWHAKKYTDHTLIICVPRMGH